MCTQRECELADRGSWLSAHALDHRDGCQRRGQRPLRTVRRPRPRTRCSLENANALPSPVTEDALRTTARAFGRPRAVGRRLPQCLDNAPHCARCLDGRVAHLAKQALRLLENWPYGQCRGRGNQKQRASYGRHVGTALSCFAHEMPNTCIPIENASRSDAPQRDRFMTFFFHVCRFALDAARDDNASTLAYR
jgi:hypothetical protein